MTDLYEIQNALRAEGFRLLCGVDEAGRGPLAGPVCAAAVILPEALRLPGLNDSKKLTARRREALYADIVSSALSWSAAFATVGEIDELNILNATYLAMNRAIALLRPAPELALIDGSQCRGIAVPCRTFVGGDARCAPIAAASIIAKVTRDRHMEELDDQFPQYGFRKHKGYGTREHYEALRAHGASPVHRRTFLRKFHEGGGW